MQRQHALVVELGRHGAFDDGAVRHPAGGRHALRQLLGLALGGKAAHDHRALPDGVDLAVGCLQRCHDQRAAGDRGGITHRGDVAAQLAGPSRNANPS